MGVPEHSISAGHRGAKRFRQAAVGFCSFCRLLPIPTAIFYPDPPYGSSDASALLRRDSPIKNVASTKQVAKLRNASTA